MDQSDQQLVQQAVTGDQEAFAVLVGRYQTLVCSIAYGITGDIARSEDIGQEAFLAGWKQLPTLNDPGSFKSWIAAITRNLAKSSFRSRRTQFDSPLPETLAADTQSAEEQMENSEERELVWQTLETLPASYREPLILFYRQGQSVTEVAELLDLTIDTAKQRLSRGRGMLRTEVTSTIERTLRSTAPSRAFTIAVVSALPLAGSKSAAAATTGAVASSLAGKAAAKTGIASAAGLGVLLGPLLGIAGGVFGAWRSWSTAQFQSQRRMIVWLVAIYLVFFSIFMAPFVAMLMGWKPHETFGRNGYTLIHGIWMAVFFGLNSLWMFVTIRGLNRLATRETTAGTEELPGYQQLRARAAAWKGRRWSSRTMFLGQPLIDVAFSDPVPAGATTPSPVVARGWIAIGDHARGRLLAIGRTATGSIAIGVYSAGLLPFGVLAVGIVPVGVLAAGPIAVGVVAVGGLACGGSIALGYLAAAHIAVGWQGAKGVTAVALHYADGTSAHAQDANNAAAAQFFASSRFFELTDSVTAKLSALNHSANALPLIVVTLITLSGAFLLSRFACRRPVEPHDNGSAVD